MRQAIVVSAIVVLAVTAVALAYASYTFSVNQEKAENTAQETPEVPANIPEDQPVAQVAGQVSPSVVQVNIRAVQATPFGPREGEGQASGVIYRTDGYIVTNNHVVQGVDEVNVGFADGSTETGEVVGADPSTDLAVVRVDRDDLPAARFAGGSDLIVGQLAVAIGSPSGFQSTVTEGVVSGLNREVPAEVTGGRQEASLVDLIQTDAAISPGSSGGALANRTGEVVGINVAYLPPQETGAESIGFAIPSDTVTSVADQLIEDGQVSNPYLGINIADLTPEAAERFDLSVESGVIVGDVESGSPAANAGLRTEDVITALGSEWLETSGDLLAAVRGYEPGDEVTLTVVRGETGDEEEIRLVLGERRE